LRPADGTPVGLRNRRSLGIAVSALSRWNARHPWSHNDHFHAWILRNLPARRSAALDVGCGRGALVEKLADQFVQVTGVDPDLEMVAVSRERLAGRPEVEIRQQSLLDTTGRYDLVTLVASLHHLPLEPALRHTAELVAPGGRLLVVGLAQLGSPSDMVVDGASLLLNPLVGMVKHPRAETGPAPAPDVPIRDPEDDFAEVRSVAERILPGVRVRRRLFFRYTLRWDARF
jgi:SAM-dependent methyltransferase